MKAPNGELKEDKREGGFSAGGVHYFVNMSAKEGEITLTTHTRSLIGDLIMLHKNQGLWYFSVLGFGVALILLYVSGLIITLFAIK